MHFATATALLAALRERSVSATELLAQTLARIDTRNPGLNAIVVQDRDRARRDAAEADAALARGDSRPLLGLPMTVKECFDVAGLPTTWGLAGTEKIPVPEDAVVVQRLRTAGAVVVGKTNVPPNLSDWQTANPIYGRTSNPWDAGRTPGGSSGGSAAALAAGLVALEIGTDIGGSLRVPAHCCGVYAHKPTHGLVPMRGCAPPGTPRLSVSSTIDLAVAGPMARSAADLELALDVIVGPDEDQSLAYSLHLPAARHRRLKDFRVLVLHGHPLLPTGAEVSDAVSRWVDRLAREGCHVSERSAQLPDMGTMARTYLQLLMAFFGAQMPPDAYEQVRRGAQSLDAGNDSPEALELRALASSHRDWIAADRVRTGMRHRWRQLFGVGDVDVVVCPVMPLPALLHDDLPMQQRTVEIDGQRLPYSCMGVWAGPATMAGLPATALPIGVGASGLPIGVQAIGPQFEDRTPLAFARLVEQAFGGFVTPESRPFHGSRRRGTQVVAVDVKGRVVANAMRFLLELAADGLGVALLGEAFASRAVSDGRLVRVLPEWNTGVDQVHARTPSSWL